MRSFRVAVLGIGCCTLGLSLAGSALWACASPTAPLVPRTSVVTVGGAGGEAEVASLEVLASIFYSRVSNRRFNSIATYEDPALREFFRSPEAFADYFADFVDDLVEARFRAERPTRAELTAIDLEGPDRCRVTVRFRGDNARPLRWWKVKLVREDVWERVDGRWWIIPSKL